MFNDSKLQKEETIRVTIASSFWDSFWQLIEPSSKGIAYVYYILIIVLGCVDILCTNISIGIFILFVQILAVLLFPALLTFMGWRNSNVNGVEYAVFSKNGFYFTRLGSLVFVSWSEVKNIKITDRLIYIVNQKIHHGLLIPIKVLERAGCLDLLLNLLHEHIKSPVEEIKIESQSKRHSALYGKS